MMVTIFGLSVIVAFLFGYTVGYNVAYKAFRENRK